MMECLEQRSLLSAVVEGDVLRIDGTKGDDAVRVLATETRLIVVENGTKTKFGRSGVLGVVVNGGQGDDRIDLRDAVLRASVRGGGGHDTIVSGQGNDTINGDAGNDRIDGGAGDDQITGASGKDMLLGGDGDDSLFAKDGKPDVLDGGDGYDFSARDTGLDRERAIETHLNTGGHH